MSKETMEFVVYMIHKCAKAWRMAPSEVYAKLTACGCIRDYLVPYYDVLHTQSSDYVLEDIRTYLSKRGATV